MKLTILIVDADREGSAALAAQLRQSPWVRAALTAEDAEKAATLAPAADLLLLDPILPGVDGVTLLHRLEQDGVCPGVFLLSPFFSSALLRECEGLGVAQCLRKPVDCGSLLRRIAGWDGQGGVRLGGAEEELAKRAGGMLKQIGMPLGLSGYQDSRYGIAWLSRRPQQMRVGFTKELYPYIAARSGQTPAQVERNIRYAIRQTWRCAGAAERAKYFDPAGGRPSNTQFLLTLAEHLRGGAGIAPPEEPPWLRDSG